MPDSVTLEMRGLVAEDFMTVASFAQTTTTILGLGSGITVTPLVSATNDTTAAAAGVPIGCLYLRTGGAFAYLAVRMT